MNSLFTSPGAQRALRNVVAVVLVGLIIFVNSVSADTPQLAVEIQELYTTSGLPDNYVANPGTGFDGVVDIIGFDNALNTNIRGTGSLIGGGRYILTAAHMLDTLDISQSNFWFDMPGGSEFRIASNFYVHPMWNGNVSDGYDIAIAELTSSAPAGAEIFDIYRGSSEVGSDAEKVGYGKGGQGNDGAILASGTKRSGFNTYDALADVFGGILNPLPGAQLAYDFDNGLAANDAFGYFGPALGTSGHLGLGALEVCGAPGDSGGPSFVDDKIAGITSYGFRLYYINPDNPGDASDSSDIDVSINSSFGEFVVDTRVSYFADWIDGVVPEPCTIALFGLGAITLFRHRV